MKLPIIIKGYPNPEDRNQAKLHDTVPVLGVVTNIEQFERVINDSLLNGKLVRRDLAVCFDANGSKVNTGTARERLQKFLTLKVYPTNSDRDAGTFGDNAVVLGTVNTTNDLKEVINIARQRRVARSELRIVCYTPSGKKLTVREGRDYF
jgi:hypothetical protein